MKLIADSGSTKTHWYLLPDTTEPNTTCHTSGINPFFQQRSDIVDVLQKEFTLPVKGISEIHFYGAGAANSSKKQELTEALSAFFDAEKIFVESDLLAVARSMCGTQKGIIAILGTGSNSGVYDGQKIIQHVSPLGYILGDEGSGAVIGRMLLSDILKNQMSKKITQAFFAKYATTQAEIMENVYRKPFPNRYMASFTPFLFEHIDEQPVHELVKKSVRAFFERNLLQYSDVLSYPVHFSGSIAYWFRDIIRQTAMETGVSIGHITEGPMQGLIIFHTDNQVFLL